MKMHFPLRSLRAPKLLALCAVVIAFAVGTAFGMASGRGLLLPDIAGRVFPGSVPPKELDYGILWDVWEELHDRYIARESLDEQKLLWGAASGLARAVGDPYTEFLDPEAMRFFTEDTRGSFEGIGVEIGMRKGVLTVISPINGTPADHAGLRPHDKILAIDGIPTADLTLFEAVAKIRGPQGTEVTLTILRAGEDAQDIGIVRGHIDVLAVEWKMLEDRIAHLTITSFSERSSQEFRAAAAEILTKNPRGIVLDLRNNPGGFLDASVEIASWFLQDGAPVVKQENARGEQTVMYSEGPGAFADFPLAVLVNEGSASAAEILAGAIQDTLERATLIGTKTFGKGSVQEVVSFSDDSALKVTIARWLTPNGRSISEEGIQPDVTVERSFEDIEAERDPQLTEALETVLNRN